MGVTTPSFDDSFGRRQDVSPGTPLPVSDSRFQIQIGNVDGFELLVIPGESFTVGKTLQDLTPTGGIQGFPVTAETWEVVSTDANDTASGTGARTGVVISLTDGYILQTTLFTLDGLTPVTLSNSHFRTRNTTILTAGADPSNTNIGNIIIRVSGGGTERMRIPAGIGDCKSLIYTVPANKSAFVQQLSMFCKKGDDCTFETFVTPQNGATIISSQLSAYQNSQVVRVAGNISLSSKTDTVVRVKSSNPDSTAVVFFTILEVENEQILNPPISSKTIP